MQGGELVVTASCFVGNNGTAQIGLEQGATLSQTGNFGSPSGESDCAGVRVGPECSLFEATACDLPGPANLPPSDGCFVDWPTLSDAVATAPPDPLIESLFRVCDGAVLEVTGAPLVISGGSATIICGDDDANSSNCTIAGGESHLRINGAPSVRVYGMTFVGATFASVLGTGDEAAVLTLENCLFQVRDAPLSMTAPG